MCVYVCILVTWKAGYAYRKTFHNSSVIWANALKQCSTWLLAYAGACDYWGLSSRRCPALQLVRERRIACWEGWCAQQCKGCRNLYSPKALSLPLLSRALLPPPPQPVCPIACLPHDRGGVGAAGVRDTCQQGDRVSSESVPCLSHSHVDWQPASADYRHCGSKRNPLWQWQAYDLQDMLILSNQHFIWRLRLCYPSLENTLLDR